MNILVTGGTGFVGTRLVEELNRQNHNVIVLSRNMSLEGALHWDECYQIKNINILPQLDLVINLMGENLANKRWTTAQKKEIRDSRVIAGQQLIEQLREADRLPKRWIQASAIGIYPKNNSFSIDEESLLKGDDFLAEVCLEWENVVNKLPEEVQSQIMRIGLVLGKEGGLIKKLTPLFQYNLGAVLSDGNQKMSWIEVNDLVRAFVYLIENPRIEILNGVSSVCTNKEFTNAFVSSLGKFKGPPVPSFALRLLLGEMSTLALDSQLVHSKHDVDYQYKDIKDLLNNLFN